MASPSRISGVDPWRTLEALSFYRVVACVALVVLSVSDYRPPYFDGPNAAFIDAALFMYLLAAAVLLVLVRSEAPGHRWQAGIQISTDIGFIIALDYATGGIASGLATLLVTPVAAGSLLLDRRLSAVPPALATISLLLVEVYLNLLYPDFAEQYTQTGILGAGLFIIAMSGSALARRARESEAQARQARSDIAKLAALSETVIQKMQAGVIVCDSDGRIELLNRAGKKMLGQDAQSGSQLSSYAPVLGERMQHWQIDPTLPANRAIEMANNNRVWARFTRLGSGDSASTLVVLDDASRVEEQAQSMKLASLGRLTASIAHEMRNPLSAIQHAAELTQESEGLSKEDRSLIEIIRRQTTRLEDVIASVLNLSRKKTAPTKAQVLKPLLGTAIAEFLETCPDREVEIQVSVEPATIAVPIETVQLTQIIHNLLDNAVTHTSNRPLKINISARMNPRAHEVQLDLRDNGPGIPKDIAGQVFEPFFSTSHQGIGLGLFITRELCAAADGQLQLITDSSQPGAYFRLSFPAALK